MAQASSYTKLTELTAEQQAKFKETATILAQGKTATDGATTDINIPFDEFGGSSSGGGGLTFGTPVTITNDMIYVDPETESNCVDINVVNNTYTEITLPSSVTESCHVIRLNITTADVPNFVCHIKNQKNGSEPTVEVHYKTSASSEDRELDFHSSMLPQHSDDIEHAPIIYSASESELGLTGEAIVTCVGLFFDLRYLYSHVPPSGTWWGIHS